MYILVLQLHLILYHCLYIKIQMSIQDYQILSKLGSGSFGVVHKARYKKNNEICVIKIVDVSNMNPKLKKSAMHEGKMMKQINSPFVVKHFNTFLNKSTLNIVMEYCPKGDLTSYMKSQMGKPLKQQTIWKFSIQMIGGLRDIHVKKILHRDIKLLNVFLDQNLNAKIGDLGVAKEMTGEFAHTIVGTPYYLSPQMCQQKPYNQKTDIWALGCVIYELCTGKRPFEANNQAALALKIVMGKYENLPSHYSSDLVWIVKSCLSLDYKRRPTAAYILGMPKTKQWAHKLNIIIDKNHQNHEKPKQKSIQKPKHIEKEAVIKQSQLAKQKSKQKPKLKQPEKQVHKKQIQIKTPVVQTPKSSVKHQKQKIFDNKVKISKQGEKNVKQVLNNKKPIDAKPPKYSGAKRLQLLEKEQKQKQQQKKIQSEKEKKKQIPKQQPIKPKQQQKNANISPKKQPEMKPVDSRQYASQPSTSNNFHKTKAQKQKTMNATMNKFLPQDFKRKKQFDLEDNSQIQEVVLPDSDDSSQQQKKKQKSEVSSSKKNSIFQKGQQQLDDEQLMKQFGIVKSNQKQESPKKQTTSNQSPNKNSQQISKFRLDKKPLSIDWNQIGSDSQKQKIKKNKSFKHEELPTIKSPTTQSQKISQMKITEQQAQQNQDETTVDEQINENRAYRSDEEEENEVDKEEQNKAQQLLIQDFDQKQQDLNLKKIQNQKRKKQIERMKNHFEPQLLKFMSKAQFQKLKIKIIDCKQQQVEQFVASWKNNIQCMNLFYRILHFDMEINRCNKNLKEIESRLDEIKKQKS